MDYELTEICQSNFQKGQKTMQLTISLPEILPNDRISQVIKKLEEIFTKEGISAKIAQELPSDVDLWDNLNIDEIAVDTGIEDFAENHDHYLYGTPKYS